MTKFTIRGSVLAAGMMADGVRGFIKILPAVPGRTDSREERPGPMTVSYGNGTPIDKSKLFEGSQVEVEGVVHCMLKDKQDNGQQGYGQKRNNNPYTNYYFEAQKVVAVSAQKAA